MRTLGQIKDAVGKPSIAAAGTFGLWAVVFLSACAANQDCKTMPRSAVKGMHLGSDFQDASIGLYAMTAILASVVVGMATKGVDALRNRAQNNALQVTAAPNETTQLLPDNRTEELNTDRGSVASIDDVPAHTAVQIQETANTAAAEAVRQKTPVAEVADQTNPSVKPPVGNGSALFPQVASADVSAPSSEGETPRSPSR